MDRERWTRWVPYLGWPCPTCQYGYLRLIPDTMREASGRKERLEQDDPSSDHNQSLKRFVAILKCDAARCGETATVTGNHYTHWMPDGSDDGFTDEGYEVFSIVPSPVPFKIERGVPKAIDRVIREAAALFWLDHKAAANRMREVVEAIVTDLGVPVLGRRGRRLVLHTRIEQFAALDGRKWLEQAELIEAAKWIGNEGTHNEMDRNAALDAFEILETVIEDIYVRGRHAVLAKARSTNSKHRGQEH